MAPPVPLPRLHRWRIRNLDKEKQTLAAPLSKQQREERRKIERERGREIGRGETWWEWRSGGERQSGKRGREASQGVALTHSHPSFLHAPANVALPPRPNPTVPNHRPRLRLLLLLLLLFFFNKKTLSAIASEVKDRERCSLSVNRMMGSSGGLEQVSEPGLILCG